MFQHLQWWVSTRQLSINIFSEPIQQFLQLLMNTHTHARQRPHRTARQHVDQPKSCSESATHDSPFREFYLGGAPIAASQMLLLVLRAGDWACAA